MIFKSLSSEIVTYAGITFYPNTEKSLSDEYLEDLKRNKSFLASISADGLLWSVDGFTSYVDIYKCLFGKKITVEEMPQNYPFDKKTLADGSKIFRRKLGYTLNCAPNAESSIEIVIPYTYCKINEMEIINCKAMDEASLLVLDKELNPFYGYSKAILNQFGFDVRLPNDFYVDKSNYDADLYKDMIIKIIYTNKSSEQRQIGINIILHEVK